MILKLSKRRIIYWAMFFVTLGSAQFFINFGISEYVEYIGLLLLLYGCYSNVKIQSRKHVANLFFLLFIMILFSTGLLQQEMEMSKIISLILSMFILASIAIMPSGFLKSLVDVRRAGYGVLSGLVVSTVLAPLVGGSLSTAASEGFVVNFGFNGGLEHRNYFSYAIIASFMAIYSFYKFGNKRKIDKQVLIIELILLISSNSRSSYIVFLVFIYFANYTKLRVSKHYKSLTLIYSLVLMSVAFVPLLQVLVTHSETFSFRMNGLANYLAMYGTDSFHLIFGNAEMAFRNSGMSYSDNIRSVIGWNGSVELVFLNILVKNGVLGLVGYVLIFWKYFMRLKKSKDAYMKVQIYGIVISFIVSALVESFLANINYVYSVMNYILIVGMISISEANFSNIDRRILKNN